MRKDTTTNHATGPGFRAFEASVAGGVIFALLAVAAPGRTELAADPAITAHVLPAEEFEQLLEPRDQYALVEKAEQPRLA